MSFNTTHTFGGLAYTVLPDMAKKLADHGIDPATWSFQALTSSNGETRPMLVLARKFTATTELRVEFLLTDVPVCTSPLEMLYSMEIRECQYEQQIKKVYLNSRDSRREVEEKMRLAHPDGWTLGEAVRDFADEALSGMPICPCCHRHLNVPVFTHYSRSSECAANAGYRPVVTGTFVKRLNRALDRRNSPEAVEAFRLIQGGAAPMAVSEDRIKRFYAAMAHHSTVLKAIQLWAWVTQHPNSAIATDIELLNDHHVERSDVTTILARFVKARRAKSASRAEAL